MAERLSGRKVVSFVVRLRLVARQTFAAFRLWPLDSYMALCVSQRGRKALGDVVDYLPYIRAAWANPYSESNPDGKILLCVAENKLAYPLLAPALREAAAAAVDDDQVSNYGDWRGRQDFRAAVARFLTRHLTGGVPVTAQHISAFCGVGALLDVLAHTLFEPGDVILIPSPYYAAFDNDLVKRAELRIQEVGLNPPDWEVTEAGLDAAEQAAGGRVAGLLLTNPYNPLGICLKRETLSMIHKWCASRKIHLISDEIYGACVFGGEDNEKGPTLQPQPRHTSVLGICPGGQLGERNHMIWGFSKDFGISGFRVGILVSANEALNEALGSLCMFACVSGHMQAMLQRILDDEIGVDAFLNANCCALRKSYTLCARRLRALAIPFVRAEAGMFVWMDLRMLDLPTREAEKQVMQELCDCHGIVLTPGLSQHASEPGWFRICYAFVEPSVLEVAMDRLESFVRKRLRLKSGDQHAQGTKGDRERSRTPRRT